LRRLLGRLDKHLPYCKACSGGEDQKACREHVTVGRMEALEELDVAFFVRELV